MTIILSQELITLGLILLHNRTLINLIYIIIRTKFLGQMHIRMKTTVGKDTKIEISETIFNCLCDNITITTV